MSGTDVTPTTVTTILHTKLHSLNIELSPSHARYQKKEKTIEISIDDKDLYVWRSYSDGYNPLTVIRRSLIPLSSTVNVSLIRKDHVLYHLSGSYSGRITDFLLDKETSFTLEDDRHVACATITMQLSPVIEFQQAVNDWVDTSLARLGNNQGLAEGVDELDQVISAMQAVNYTVETCRQYIALLGQALRLMIKLIDNVADVHPLLKVGWSLLSLVYMAVQKEKLNVRDIQGLAESLRELVGMASDCPVAEIRGTDVIESIERLALEVALLMDEYTGRSFMEHLGKAQIMQIKAQITVCQAMVKDLYEGLRTKIIARMANHVKEMQENAKRRDADKLVKDIREWLSAPNTSVNHKSARDICVEGTGSCSTTVEGVRKHTGPQGPTCGFAYFYFDGREAGAALEKFETLLQSILAQLCFNQADIPDVMKHLTTLEEVLKGFNEVYILIDTLDECDSQVELLDWMDSLQLTPPGLHLLATSRPVRIIEERMPNSSHVRIPLTSDLLDNNIKTYVDGHVKASNDLKLLMTKEMKKKLRIRGDGM
ncbi:hypothetical protein PAXINDRAFT_13528 [Paxillus involutus ATCC 200175]|uniref:Nephrocystin 3-like N-terminal domain-containing protein n=1 Tax=Paxillus involutus ATCC 200175 TaxID=664439 RepID=A0A0C9SVV4_PAXIN|nr:hypothetical protein PAXINDRAFT_13528 [Paxillus involutus ATCC 200175]